jgi:response regulator RpfG family c-di-GMP phosphodiesterase
MKTVLLVDDEAAILKCWARTLGSEEWRVVRCDDASEAIAILSTLRVDAVVAGYRMPEMSGAELLERAREIQPLARRVLLSGTPEAVADEVDVETVVLPKPWMRSDLVGAVAGSPYANALPFAA